MKKTIEFEKMSNGYLGSLNSNEQEKMIKDLFTILDATFGIYSTYDEMEDYLDIVLDLEENILQNSECWSRESILQLSMNTGAMPERTYNSASLMLETMRTLAGMSEDIVMEEPEIALRKSSALINISERVLLYTLVTMNRLFKLGDLMKNLESEESEIDMISEVLVKTFGAELENKLKFYHRVYEKINPKLQVISEKTFKKLEEMFPDDIDRIESVLFTAYDHFNEDHAKMLISGDIDLTQFEDLYE